MAYKQNDNQQIFDEIATKFTQLLYGPKDGDKNRILKALDNLNALDYRYVFVTNSTKAALLVNQCVTLIPPDDLSLVQKCCQLITNLVAHQKQTIEGRTFTVTIDWCLQALKCKNIETTPDILLALHSLLSSQLNNPPETIDCILTNESPVIVFARENQLEEHILLAVQCLVVCTKTKLSQSQLKVTSEIFCAKLLSNQVSHDKELLRAKLLGISLKGLQNIVEQSENYLNVELGMLLGIVKCYMVFGLKGVGFVVPEKVVPSVLSLPEPNVYPPREKKGGKIAKQRKHRYDGNKDGKKVDEFCDFKGGYVPVGGQLVENVNDRLKTSDSDFSDTESGRISKIHITQGRVRQAALGLLLTIIKHVDKRVLFSYWSSLIPDTPSTGTHYITTCILKDTSVRGRMAASNVLLALLTRAKLYLFQAESSIKTTSFTPFSVVLGLTLKELHRCLSLALNDNSIPVLTQILKCFAVLIQATPYHKLEAGLITKIIRNVKPFIYHRDATVQVAALIVLGCIVASEPCVPETKEALLKITQNNLDVFSSDDEEQISNFTVPINDNSSDGMSWLLEKCLNNLKYPAVPIPIKLESLQVISAMSRNYFATIMADHILLIATAIIHAISDRYCELRLHAGRTVDFLGVAMDKYFGENAATLMDGVEFWMMLLNGPLVGLLQDEENAALRGVGCDCLSGMGARVFEKLPADKQILVITLLFGCTRDEECTVRGAAVRALGVCVLFPNLREDAGYVIDTVEAINRTIYEKNPTVRTKASWALGNLTDALILNPNNSDVSEDLLLKLFQMAIACSKDNDRIKSNGVRALGNLLQLVDETLLTADDRFIETTADACNVLLFNANCNGNMKVRWNACYAFGSVLRNSHLFKNKSIDFKKIFNILMELVVSFRNFKVRINAALALVAPRSRDYYGEAFVAIWIALMKALETSQNMEDFTEYKHRDHLIQQICLGIAHLTLLITKDDLYQLKDTIAHKFEMLKSHMHRVTERIVPEKSSILYEASAFLEAKLALEEWHMYKETLKLLSKIFVEN